jgi:methylamine--corrinoid protein Co-methyltransferase
MNGVTGFNRMVDFWEVLKRCSVGEVLDERDYDRLLWKNIAVLVDKYDIKYDPESIVPTDNELADRAFAAAMELFLNLGFYCIDTRHRVCFSREELEDRLEAASLLRVHFRESQSCQDIQ